MMPTGLYKIFSAFICDPLAVRPDVHPRRADGGTATFILKVPPRRRRETADFARRPTSPIVSAI